MRAAAEREWLERLSTAPTPALKHVVRMAKENSALLIRGAFTDDQGGKCLAEWFGHYMGLSGPEFLRSVGLPLVSEVVYAWDTDPRFRAQIIKAIRMELFFRKGVRLESTGVQAVGGSSRRLHSASTSVR